MEQLEVQEHESCRLRRELKELKHTVTLRRILTYGGMSDTKNHSHIHTHDTQLKWNSVTWLFSGPAPFASQNTVNAPQHSSPALAGLLECRKRDESRLIKNLITGTYTHR